MNEFLTFIFGEVDFNTVTPVAIVCIYTFALILETIGNIFYATMKGGAIR